MCGIYAVINSPNAVLEVLDGLKRLEYRGYDSFGISVLHNGKIFTYRAIGKPTEANVQEIQEQLPAGKIAIGHTRWATNGEVCIKNTHPIECEPWSVVHNGIVNNHAEFTFDRKTNTDSEVIAYLLSQNLSPKELLKGQLTYIALSPAKLIAYSNYTPIYKRVDGEKITLMSFSLFNNGIFEEIKDWEYKIMENTFKHEYFGFTTMYEWDQFSYSNGMLTYMELNEIPGIRIKIPEKITLNARSVLTVGSGSSFYASLICSYLDPSETVSKNSSELHPTDVLNFDTIIAFSQSGETKDLLDLLIYKRPSQKIIAITNYPNSSLGKKADEIIQLCVGEERAVAATKSFYAQCVAALTLYKREERPSSEDLQLALDTTDSIIPDQIIILGSELNYIAALEGALKLKELAYIWAEGINTGEFKHGPLALVDHNFTCILLDKNERGKQLKNIIESRGGKVIESPFENFLANAVWLQKLAYNSSMVRGINPDYPRNLAKSITV